MVIVDFILLFTRNRCIFSLKFTAFIMLILFFFMCFSLLELTCQRKVSVCLVIYPSAHNAPGTCVLYAQSCLTLTACQELLNR